MARVMIMSNSKLVSYTKLSPNHSGKRTHKIDRISPHCVVGQVTVQRLGDIFTPKSKQASCNYGIGKDGKIGMYVAEGNHSWCTSSYANDSRAVTIECASDTMHPYKMNSKVYKSLVKLCVDICKRNGKKKLLWISNKKKALNYSPKSDEMVLTIHRWFKNKACPGDWLVARLGKLATEVTKQLGGSTSSSSSSTSSSSSSKTKLNYKVKITADVLNVREQPNASSKIKTKVKKGETYTIVQTKNGWGKLKSGAGWINLSYTKKI